MNFEKIVGSKWYSILDWLYKLIVMNLFTILIPMLGGAIPFWIFMETSHILPLIISFFVVFILFIPCFVTNFHLIKMNYDMKSTGIVKAYLYDFISYFKQTIVINGVTSIIALVLLYAGYTYWHILGEETFVFNFLGIVSLLGFWVAFMVLFAMFISYLHLPAMMSYFKMSRWNYAKGAAYMAFRYFFKSLLFVILVITPFALVILWMNGFTISVWVLLGISIPELFMYIVARPTYWNIANNVISTKEKEIYRFEGEKDNETRN